MIITILAVVAVTAAIASQSCPIGKSDCQVICQRNGACELGKGCGIKDKKKECEKDKEKEQERDCEKDPNSDS